MSFLKEFLNLSIISFVQVNGYSSNLLMFRMNVFFLNFGLKNLYFRSVNTWHKLRKLICYACFKWTLSGDSVNHTTFIRTKSLSNWYPKGLKYISADEWIQSILNDHKFCFFNPPTLALHRRLLRSNDRYRFVSKILKVKFLGTVLLKVQFLASVQI